MELGTNRRFSFFFLAALLYALRVYVRVKSVVEILLLHWKKEYFVSNCFINVNSCFKFTDKFKKRNVTSVIISFLILLYHIWKKRNIFLGLEKFIYLNIFQIFLHKLLLRFQTIKGFPPLSACVLLFPFSLKWR